MFVGGDQRATGLFGASDVWVSEVASTQARRLLVEEQQPPAWTLPPAGTTRPAELTLGRRALPCAVRVLPPEVPAPPAPVPAGATAAATPAASRSRDEPEPAEQGGTPA